VNFPCTSVHESAVSKYVSMRLCVSREGYDVSAGKPGVYLVNR